MRTASQLFITSSQQRFDILGNFFFIKDLDENAETTRTVKMDLQKVSQKAEHTQTGNHARL